MTLQLFSRQRGRNRSWSRQWLPGLALATAATVLLSAPAALAGDPFRPNDPHPIGDATEAAFEAFFKQGDYVAAEDLVQAAIVADPQEPMNHAMAAALAYLNGTDRASLDELNRRAQITQELARTLEATDPLRGHIYQAVGIFLEGAYILQKEGIAQSTPTVLGMLRQVYSQLDRATAIDPNDPELSLLKGFMDLLLAVNLPFANPDQAIARLNNGYPVYLSQRGIALGLRDLQRYPEAEAAVDAALAAAPSNPDLLYLKAQILKLSGDNATSLTYYAEALTYAEQLPIGTVRQLRFEQCLTEGVDMPTCAVRSNINGDNPEGDL